MKRKLVHWMSRRRLYIQHVEKLRQRAFKTCFTSTYPPWRPLHPHYDHSIVWKLMEVFLLQFWWHENYPSFTLALSVWLCVGRAQMCYWCRHCDTPWTHPSGVWKRVVHWSIVNLASLWRDHKDPCENATYRHCKQARVSVSRSLCHPKSAQHYTNCPKIESN